MSGTLAGFPEVGGERSADSYEPGKEPADMGLATRLAGLFWDGTCKYPFDWAHTGKEMFRQATALLGEVISSAEGEMPEHNVLLDQLVMLIHPGCSSGHLGRAANFFTAMLQALYEHGGNDFGLDLSPLTAAEADFRDSFVFGSYLSGTHEERLRFSCAGIFDEFCPDAACLDATMLGTAIRAGDHASSSVFRLVGAVGFAGNHSARSEFYVERPGCVMPSGYKNSFYVSRGVDDETLLRLMHPVKDDRLSSFWRNRNVLLVPDGSGGWKEVEP